MSDQQPSPPDQPGRPDRITEDRSGITPARILGAVLFLIVLIFIFQNGQAVTIEFFNIDVSAPLWVTTLSLLTLGAIIGWLLSSRQSRR